MGLLSKQVAVLSLRMDGCGMEVLAETAGQMVDVKFGSGWVAVLSIRQLKVVMGLGESCGWRDGWR